jgi:dihydroflavonol-4-reductase
LYKTSMKRALVTGGCGFLGSAITRRLLDRGVAVRVMALPGEATTNVDGLDIEITRGNVLSREDCIAAVAGCDVVFHAAAIYKSYMPDPTPMYEVNSRGTFHVIEACRRGEVSTVVYTASIVALGRPSEGTLGDEDTRYDAWSLNFPYSLAKYHSRKIAEDFAAWGYDVRVVCPGIVFGPGDIAPTPSGKLIIGSAQGGPPIYVDGGATYVDVRDAAEAHVLAAEKGRAGERYVATGHNLSNLDLIEAVDRVLGKQRKYVRMPVAIARKLVHAMASAAIKKGREPDLAPDFFEYSLKPSYFRNDKSRRDLGASYRPIEDTIRDAVEYFRKTGRM